MSRTVPWTMVLILLLAAGLRLHHLDEQSLWGDEGCMLYLAREAPGRIVAILAAPDRPDVDIAPPLYMLLLHGWMRCFGDSVAAVRGLSVLLGVAAVAAVCGAGRRLDGIGTAQAAGLLAAVSPMLIWYSQEARMYSLGALLVALMVLLLHRAATRGRRRDWLFLGLVNLAGLYTQYYFILFLAVQPIYLLGERFLARRDPPDPDGAISRPGDLALAWALPAVLMIPWLPVLRSDFLQAAGPRPFPARFSPITSLPFVLAKMATFGSETYVREHLVLYALAALVFGMALAAALRRMDSAGRLLWLQLLLPMGIVWIATLAGLRIYKSHPFVQLVPVLLLLVGRGVTRLGRPGLILLAAAVGINGFVLATLNFGGEYTKPRVGQVARKLADEIRPGDRVIGLPAALPCPLATMGDLLVWDYYARRVGLPVHTPIGADAAEILVEIDPTPLDGNRLFVVSQDSEVLRPHRERILDGLSRTYRLEETRRFPSRFRGFGLLVHTYRDPEP